MMGMVGTPEIAMMVASVNCTCFNNSRRG